MKIRKAMCWGLAAAFVALGSCAPAEQKKNGGAEAGVAAETVKQEKTEAGSLPEPQGNPLENAEGRMTPKGLVVAGEGDQKRAFSAFRSGEGITRNYINLINDFRKEFPDANLYAVVIPGAGAYYLPKKLESSAKPIGPAFEYLKAHLDPTIKYVDVYNTLAGHTMENIYSRTDHHWQPLGAYYTAQALAEQAGVPFKDLSNYDEHVVHGYVGSMVKYTGDSSLRDHPEDFVYHTPKGVNATTTYIAYKTDPDTKKVISESKPYQRDFFHHYPDGAGGAYCTFMGGDHSLVKVETGAPNQRRLLIIKDSHGNPIPAYLFYSFDQIHVVDYRYFTKNLKKYVADNNITDIALAFGVNTTGAGNMQKVRDFLTQNPD